MADPYVPPRPGTLRPASARPGTDPYRDDARADFASTAATEPESRSRISTGVIVAIVLVIAAIIAAVMFSNRVGTDQGLRTTPPATIENNAAPAETVIEPTAPALAPGTPTDPAAPAAPANP